MDEGSRIHRQINEETLVDALVAGWAAFLIAGIAVAVPAWTVWAVWAGLAGATGAHLSQRAWWPPLRAALTR